MITLIVNYALYADIRNLSKLAFFSLARWECVYDKFDFIMLYIVIAALCSQKIYSGSITRVNLPHILAQELGEIQNTWELCGERNIHGIISVFEHIE